MAVLVGLLLVVFCIGVALYPFFKRRFSSQRAEDASSVQDIVDRRQAIYDALETLESEHSSGNVDEEEYEERSREYRLAAAATFRDQEMMEDADVEVEEAIGRELARWRETQLDGVGASLCPACGNPPGDDKEHCSHCGQRAEAS